MPDDFRMGAVTDLVNRLNEAQFEVTRKKRELKAAEEAYRTLACEDLPAAMDEVGQTSVTLVDGTTLEIKDKMRASFPSGTSPESLEKRDRSFEWLRTEGHEDLITRDIALQFGRGEYGAADTLMSQLVDDGYAPKDKEGVNTGTLKAFVKDQLAEGVDVPLEDMGIYTYREAVIKENQ